MKYTTKEILTGGVWDDHQPLLDEMSREGWKLIQIVPLNLEGTTNELRFYFQKPRNRNTDLIGNTPLEVYDNSGEPA